MFNLPKGPFCQSCGIPLDTNELLGTEANGEQSKEFCTYCYQSGEFVAPEITMQEMIKKATAILIDKANMPAMQATIVTNTFIPNLKRWK